MFRLMETEACIILPTISAEKKLSRHARALTHSLGPEDQSTGHQTQRIHKLAMNYWLIALIFKFISK